MVDSISAAQARRIALAAQGFGRAPAAATGVRQLRSAVSRLGLLQLDSVNVFERSHYLPLFARVGAYEKADLDRLTFDRRGDYTEYWAHEAAVIPVEHWPLFRWRMDAFRHYYATNQKAWMQSDTKSVKWVLAELAEKGPLAASQIEDDSRSGKNGWWDWSDTKRALEYLFAIGEVVSAGRTRFQRRYALREQVLPRHVLDRHVSRDDAVRQLLAQSARAHGIGTLRDLADYYRIKQAPAKAAIDELVEAGELRPVTVAGWKAPAWLHRDARIPRRIDAAALLSPFDPVVWERARAERMFGFTTASRSTRQSPSGCLAITHCPCWSTMNSSAASISRMIGRRACSGCSRPGARRTLRQASRSVLCLCSRRRGRGRGSSRWSLLGAATCHPLLPAPGAKPVLCDDDACSRLAPRLRRRARPLPRACRLCADPPDRGPCLRRELRRAVGVSLANADRDRERAA